MSQTAWSKQYYPHLRSELNRKRLSPLYPGMPQYEWETAQWMLVYLDSHPTHIFDTGVLVDALANKMVFMNFPGHHTHVLQPLDSGLFTSFKVFVLGSCLT